MPVLSILSATRHDVLQTVLLTNTASIILAHNHPSGEAEPSLYDRHFTRRLIEVSTLVDVEIFDHIIIGDREFSSIAAVTQDDCTDTLYERQRDVLGRARSRAGIVWTRAPLTFGRHPRRPESTMSSYRMVE